MNKAGIIAGNIVFVLIAIGACFLAASDSLARAQPSPATVIGIDVETSGNGQSALGPIDKCIEVSSGETFDVDVFLNAVPQNQDFSAQEYFLNFDNTKLAPVAENYDARLILLGRAPGSRILDVSEIRTSSFHSVVLDSRVPPEEAAEQPGELGLLGRYTFQAIDSGFTALYLSDITLGNSAGDDWFATDVDEVWDGNSGYGRVAIDALCSEWETAAPSPTLTATPAPTATVPATATPTALTTTVPATATPAVPTPTEEGDSAAGPGDMPWIAVYAAVGAVAVLGVGALALARARRR
jgi:hypothetical protein